MDSYYVEAYVVPIHETDASKMVRIKFYVDTTYQPWMVGFQSDVRATLKGLNYKPCSDAVVIHREQEDD